MEASIDKYSKEITRIRNDDQIRWTKRFKDASRAVDSLKREIDEQDLSSILEIFLNKKATDIENSKLLMKSAHVNKINSAFQIELERWNEIAMKSSEILQDNFLVLRSLGELDNGMIGKMQTLSKMLSGQRNVKFAEEEEFAAPLTLNPEETENLALKNILDLSDDLLQSPVSVKKRTRDDNEIESESKKSKNSEAFQFLRPKALKSINFDGATTSGEDPKIDRDLNITFDLEDVKSSKALPVVFKCPPPATKLSDRSNCASSLTRSTSSVSTKGLPTFFIFSLQLY